MKKILFFFVCTCAFVYNVDVDDPCASVYFDSSCKCVSNKKWNVKVDCESEDNFVILSLTESDVTTLELSNVNLGLIKSDTFIKKKLKKLILRNVNAYQVSVPNYFSENSENLKMLEVYNSWSVFAWNFNKFGKLKQLTHLVIADSHLWYYMDSRFNDLHNLEYLELRNDKLESLSDNQFSYLNNLRLLSLSGNKLKKIEREIFPQPAEKLWHLDLSHNKLEKLPADIFDNMPQLKEIRLENNKIEKLSETIFSSIRFQLKELWIHDNRLDCRKKLSKMKHLPVYTWIAQCITENQR